MVLLNMENSAHHFPDKNHGKPPQVIIFEFSNTEMSVITAPNVTAEFLQCWLQVNNITLEKLTIKTVRHTVSNFFSELKASS